MKTQHSKPAWAAIAAVEFAKGETKFTSAAESYGNNTILKAQGGHVYSIIFNVEIFDAETLGKAICLDQGSHACGYIDIVFSFDW